MAGLVDRDAIAHAHHQYYCHRGGHACTEVDEFDYDFADNLSEILSLIPQTDDGAAVAAQSMGGSLPPAAPSSLTEACDHSESLYGRCVACGMTWEQQASANGPGPIATIGGQPGPGVPRRFQLYRHTDISHVSGVGVVASGAQFPDGSVAVRWHGAHPSTVAWNSIADAIAVHGHSGATEVRWLDDEAATL